MNDTQSKLTLPNLLTGFRFVAAPVLLWLAWNGHGIAFMGLLAIAFLNRFARWHGARLTGQVTQFGATLDSWADVITYLTIALCCWWLWPEVVTPRTVLCRPDCSQLPVAGAGGHSQVRTLHQLSYLGSQNRRCIHGPDLVYAVFGWSGMAVSNCGGYMHTGRH